MPVRGADLQTAIAVGKTDARGQGLPRAPAPPSPQLDPRAAGDGVPPRRQLPPRWRRGVAYSRRKASARVVLALQGARSCCVASGLLCSRRPWRGGAGNAAGGAYRGDFLWRRPALPAVSAQIWLTTNMASFGYNGTVLALVPALPAMLMVCFLAWRVRREVADRISLRQVRALSFAYLATPLLLTLVAWLMLYDASMVFPRLKLPNLGLALLSTLCLHLLALLWGMGTRLIRALLRRRGLPEWWVYAARLAAEYLLWLWLAGAVVVVISLLWHQSAVAQAYAIASGSAEVIALSALSVAYLPNIAWAAAGVLVGGSANIGVAEVSLFAVIPGQLPPLPVLAAIPQSGAPWAFGLLVLIPAAISVWRVLRLVRSGVTSRPYLVVVVAAIVAGVLAAIGAWLLGGEIGYFGPSGTIAWMMGVLVSLWLVLPGAVVVVVLTGVPGHWLRSKDDSAPAVEPVAEPAVDSVAESTAEPVAESTAEPVAESTAENVSAPESENSDVADSASAKSDAVDSESTTLKLR